MGTVIVVNETQDEKRVSLHVDIADLPDVQAAGEGSTTGESHAEPPDAGDGSPAPPVHDAAPAEERSAEAGWRKRAQRTLERAERKARGEASQRAASASEFEPAPTEGKDSPEVPRAIIIPAGAGIKISEEQLRLYDYEPMVQRGDIAVIAVEAPEAVSAYSLVTNKTARRIGIKNKKPRAKDKLIVPAFGTRRMLRSKLEGYVYKAWEKFNLISVSEDAEEDEGAPVQWALSLASVVAVYGYLLVFFFEDSIRGWPIWPGAWSAWWSPLVGALAIVVFGYPIELVIKNWGSEKGKALRTAFGRSLNLLVLLILGPIGLPVLVALFFGGVLSGLQGVDLLNPDVGLLMRLVQLLLIVLLSALPGLLYFQFERRQERALRNRFIRDIMLLNPWVHTQDDAEIMYGSMVDRVSSTIGANTRQFTIFASGLPILLATLLTTAGWIFALWPVGPISDDMSIYALLTPYPTAIIFAFLGAYFFALNLVFRRYARGDLTPKAYSHIVVRILSSIIVVWAVSVLFAASGEENGIEIATDSWLLLVFAFGIGIWPETGIALLKDSVRQSKRLNNFFPSLSVAHPITELEGISLYDRARLLEEGIDSVETLAHHNLIELMLQSGIPTPRLVDLVDQAILYLHVTGVVRENSDHERARGIHVLRDAGIRNATDLLQVVAAQARRVEQAKEKGDQKAVREATRERKRFFEMLDPEPAFGTTKHRMQMVLDALQDDEYLEYVKNWRLLSSSQEIINDPEHFYEDREAA